MILLSTVTMLYISRSCSPCMSESLYPITNTFPFLPLLAPGNHHSSLCFKQFTFFRFHM